MKPHKFLIAAVLCGAGVFFTGCSDWLDYTPQDKQTFDKQFSTEEGFHNAVNGCYNLLTSSSLYGYNLSYGPIEVMGNCYFIQSTNQSMSELASGTYTGNYASAVFSSIWSSAYNTILNINTVLSAIDEFPDVLRPNDARMLKGELTGLRAFIHLDLVRLFGPSPFLPTAMTELTVPYADTKEVMRRDRLTLEDIIKNKIVPDLTAAQELLEDTDPVLTDGVLNTSVDGVSNWSRYRQLRFNYYAATLAKARAFLWIKDFDNAQAEADKIVKDTHVAEAFPWVEPGKLLANRLNPDRVFSTECIFGFYNSTMSDIYDFNFAGTLNESVQLCPVRGYLSKLFSATTDYRYQSQWSTSVSSITDMDFIKYKSFKANSDTPEFYATYFGLMRITEAYLIGAECCYNRADIPGMVSYLNPVRAARGLSQYPSMWMPAELSREMRLEYLRDMRGEGQIFFLHKRNMQTFRGNAHFDGSGTNQASERPSATVRYSVPIPSAENY